MRVVTATSSEDRHGRVIWFGHIEEHRDAVTSYCLRGPWGVREFATEDEAQFAADLEAGRVAARVADEKAEAEMRGWLLDCGADPEDVALLSAQGLRRMIGRHYVGGVSQFITDAAPVAVTL